MTCRLRLFVLKQPVQISIIGYLYITNYYLTTFNSMSLPSLLKQHNLGLLPYGKKDGTRRITKRASLADHIVRADSPFGQIK